MTGNEHLMKDLIAKGIDPYSCEYLGENGCKIPWEKRPWQCKTFKCEQLSEKDATEEEVPVVVIEREY